MTYPNVSVVVFLELSWWLACLRNVVTAKLHAAWRSIPAKTPLGGPAQVLEYLSHYTHRTAISNERIRAVTDHEVTFTVRANDKGGKRLERLPGAEFVRRVCTICHRSNAPLC
jgi:hypothetical protein